MKLSYETLFELNIIHHYHLDNGQDIYDTLSDKEKFAFSKRYRVPDFMDIYPTQATKKMLGSYHILCKGTGDGIIAGVRYKTEAGKKIPEVMPGNTHCFSFGIRINDPLFANYTILPLQSLPGMVYYFTNDPAFSSRVFPHLSATPGVYAAGQVYYPGDMVADNIVAPTKLYIALKKNSLDPASMATPAGNWTTDPLVNGSPLGYVNAADIIRRFSSLFIYEVSVPDKLPALTITDRNGNIMNVITFTETGSLNKLKADISALPDGLYKADIATADLSYTDNFYFYHIADNSAWGIVDIYVKTGTSAYDLFNADDSLRSPGFNLRFKNRSTFWRYIGEKFGAASVSDNALPLTSQGFVSIKVKDKNNVLTTVDLPNASAASIIKPELNQIFSDIFI